MDVLEKPLFFRTSNDADIQNKYKIKAILNQLFKNKVKEQKNSDLNEV